MCLSGEGDNNLWWSSCGVVVDDVAVGVGESPNTNVDKVCRAVGVVHW